jgi:hypothetical protein
MEQLATWPDLVTAPSSCGTGSALRAGHRELVHMHGSREADVRLTADLIARLHDQLSHSTAVRLHDDSVWVTVHLDCDDDADLLVTLTSLSLQAHAPRHRLIPRPPRPQRLVPGCNLGRVDILR